MPWCPKCKNEYVDGVTTCADCGCELVASLEEVPGEGLTFGEEEEMNALYTFLCSNGIHAKLDYDEAEKVFEVLVAAEDRPKAERFMRTFAAGVSETNPVAAKKAVPAEAVYEAASEKAENFRSGAYVLVAVGIAGLVFLALVLAGVLPIRLTGSSGILTGTVMGALFLVFLVMGILSFKSSRKYEGKAKEESALKEELRRWCRENLSAVAIDEAIPELPEEEEARYFKRTEYIREQISRNFLNLEPAYLENFVDEIYPEYFEG